MYLYHHHADCFCTVMDPAPVTSASRHGGVLLEDLDPYDKIPTRTRPPKESDKIDESPLRGSCSAPMRFICWKTPFGEQRRRAIIEKFGQEYYLRLRLVLLHSIKSSTMSSYAAGLLRFTQFCDKLGIPEEERMPASDLLLSMFAASQAGKVAACDGWIDGIRFHHQINFAPWLGDELLKRVCKGVSNLAPDSSKRPPRPPVTLEHMDALYAGIDWNSNEEVAAYACATTAFWTCSRLGELLPVGDFNPRIHVTRDKLKLASAAQARNKAWHVVFDIPFDKVNGRKGATIQIINHAVKTSALAALAMHMHEVNIDLPPDAPLFAYADGAGGWRALTKTRLMDICTRIWKAAGLVSIEFGHSFRIGGATELLLRGVHPDAVMKQGRWLSRAFLRYWRRIQEILPLFCLSDSFSAASESRLDKSMTAFSTFLGSASDESDRSKSARAKASRSKTTSRAKTKH